MTKNNSTRHIHKTLKYLSPEKFAELRHPFPFKRLPFFHVGKVKTNSHWALPATGDYFGGYEAGKAMAQAFLKHLATDYDSFNAYLLLSIIEDQNNRLHEAIERHQCKDLNTTKWPTEPASLRGQRTGFINTIGEALAASIKILSPLFDDVSEDEIIQRANHALKRTDAEVYALAEAADKLAEKGQ